MLFFNERINMTYKEIKESLEKYTKDNYRDLIKSIKNISKYNMVKMPGTLLKKYPIKSTKEKHRRI